MHAEGREDGMRVKEGIREGGGVSQGQGMNYGAQHLLLYTSINFWSTKRKPLQ